MVAKNASAYRHQGRQIRHEQMSNPTSPSDTAAVHGVTLVVYTTDVPNIHCSEGRRGPEFKRSFGAPRKGYGTITGEAHQGRQIRHEQMGF